MTTMRVMGKRFAPIALAAICVVTLLSGCPEAPPREVLRRDEPVSGYAYTAVLAARHPLWEALVRLEEALAELAEDEWTPVLEPRERRFERVVLLESYAFADPEERIDALLTSWRAQYPQIVPDREELRTDLVARIDWEESRAAAMVRRRMAAAEAEESRRLAQIRARLVRYHQERLTNLAIDAEIRDSETAAAAEQERQRVWDSIEWEMEAERQLGREKLAALEEEISAEAEERIQRARDRAEAVLAEREAEISQVGADLYDEMVEAMQAPWPDTGEGSAAATAEPDEANVRLDAAEATRERAELARTDKAALQRERLLQSIGRLRTQIKTGTEQAARVVAYRRGIDLQLLPGEAAHGQDFTSAIAEDLEEFWRFGER